ncbi:MAG: cbb3-type cytochrome c oxidase subunit 3 [Blastomonas sp.]
MSYETLRHIADSWGLLAMLILFVCLCGWAFRPGSRDSNRRAATMIFDEDHDNVG